MSALPEVEYAEPDAIMQPTLTPNDPQYGNQWHYFAPGAGHYGINAPAAWDITTGSSSIVVAVIDTGITNHADLAGRTVPGYDFITNVAGRQMMGMAATAIPAIRAIGSPPPRTVRDTSLVVA